MCIYIYIYITIIIQNCNTLCIGGLTPNRVLPGSIKLLFLFDGWLAGWSTGKEKCTLVFGSRLSFCLTTEWKCPCNCQFGKSWIQEFWCGAVAGSGIHQADLNQTGTSQGICRFVEVRLTQDTTPIRHWKAGEIQVMVRDRPPIPPGL